MLGCEGEQDVGRIMPTAGTSMVGIAETPLGVPNARNCKGVEGESESCAGGGRRQCARITRGFWISGRVKKNPWMWARCLKVPELTNQGLHLGPCHLRYFPGTAKLSRCPLYPSTESLNPVN